MKKVVMIGLGGIGLRLARETAFYLVHNFSPDDIGLLLVDGDDYKPENMERQDFPMLGNKALALQKEFQRKYQSALAVEAVSEMASLENLPNLLHNEDICLTAPDRHYVRRIISEHAERLKDITVISGGNNDYLGNVIIHHRRNGVNLTHPLASIYHPDILNAIKEPPVAEGCLERQWQSGMVNNLVAAYMLERLEAVLSGRDLNWEEIVFNLMTGQCQTHSRIVRGEKL